MSEVTPQCMCATTVAVEEQ